MSAGTDGKIALWEINKYLTKFLSGYKYHSVKTLQGNDKLTTSPPHSKNGENILTNQNLDRSNQANLGEMSKDPANVLADDNKIVDTTCLSENSSSKKNSDIDEEDRINEPLFVISSHQSGINGISTLDLHGKNFNGQHFVFNIDFDSIYIKLPPIFKFYLHFLKNWILICTLLKII